MASVLKPRPDGDSVQMGSPGEEMRWTQAFTYVNDKTPPATVWEVLDDPIVPKQGQRYAPNPAETFPPPSTSLQRFVCRSVDASPVPQSPHAWNVRVTWSTRAANVAGRPWFNLTRTTSFRTVALYRGGPTIFNGVPDDGTVPYPPTAWIGGDKVDSNFTPISAQVAQQSIQVDVLWDRTKDTAPDALGGAADSPDPPSEWTSNFMETRNSQPFLGWPAGYVRYLGWTANEAPDEWLVVSHRFMADDWQFLEQRTLAAANGQKMMDAGPSWGSSPAFPTQAHRYVAWYQPYRRLGDYWTLFDGWAGLKDALTKPLPRWQGQP